MECVLTIPETNGELRAHPFRTEERDALLFCIFNSKWEILQQEMDSVCFSLQHSQSFTQPQETSPACACCWEKKQP